jgi:hypothetical protein
MGDTPLVMPAFDMQALLVGLVLVVACDPQPQASVDTDTETSTSSTSTAAGNESDVTTDESTGTETTEAGDGDGDTGGCVSDCNDDDDCEPFAYCLDTNTCQVCTSAGSPPPDCPDAFTSEPTFLEPGVWSLGLVFADTNDDGRDELVVASETELLVYKLGNDFPTVTAREPGSLSIISMTAGPLDGLPGDEVLLLVNDEVHRYQADGLAGFATPSIEPQTILVPNGLLVGDFDGQSPSDLLLWASGGVILELGSGGSTQFFDDGVSEGAAFEFGSPFAGMMFTSYSSHTFDLAGNLLGEGGHLGNHQIVAVEAADAGAYVGSVWEGGLSWGELRSFDPVTAAPLGTLFVDGLTDIASADLDGDGNDELISSGYQALTIFFDPLGDACRVEVDFPGSATAIVAGDHDGDGDDELALSWAESTSIMLVDGE